MKKLYIVQEKYTYTFFGVFGNKNKAEKTAKAIDGFVEEFGLTDEGQTVALIVGGIDATDIPFKKEYGLEGV